MKITPFLTAFLVLILLNHAGALPADEERLVTANNAFTIDLFKQLAQQPGNVIVSPFSVDTALLMAYAGARGETAAQMAGVLHLSNGDASVHSACAALLKHLNRENDGNNQLLVANSLWAQRGYLFEKPFQMLLHSNYDASLNILDLTGWPGDFDPAKAAAARDKINGWVSAQTRGKINTILPPALPDADTRLILANAVYFKGFWAVSFNKDDTKNSPFYVGSGQTVSVPAMHKTETCLYTENTGLQMLEMPYRSGRLSMEILLPKAKDGLAALEQTLTLEQIGQLRQTSFSTEINISLPKFKETSQFDLVKPLEDLGMKDAFGDADFSGITPATPFYIEAVLHKAYVSVDEAGTEAAAATAVAFADKAAPAPPREFNADHPFLFWIRDNETGAILFMGRVANPLKVAQ